MAVRQSADYVEEWALPNRERREGELTNEVERKGEKREEETRRIGRIRPMTRSAFMAFSVNFHPFLRQIASANYLESPP